MSQQSLTLKIFTVDKTRKSQPAFNPIYFTVCTKLVLCRTENTIEILTDVIKRLKEGDEQEEREELELEQGQEGDEGDSDEQESIEREEGDRKPVLIFTCRRNTFAPIFFSASHFIPPIRIADSLFFNPLPTKYFLCHTKSP